MKIDLAFITHNRLEYTKLALASVLADPQEEFSLTIWDNASTDGTDKYLKAEVKDPRIKQVILSAENVGQIAAVNQIWSQSKADLVGKLDNDCLLTPGWTRTLGRAHADISELGVVACWHFFPEDFDFEKARHKIQRFGQHQILRHPWTCGTGLLVKRSTYERFGPIRGDGTTSYWIDLAKAGLVNGFYYPLVFQEHMDDTRSKHSRLRSMSFKEAFRFSPNARSEALEDLENYRRLHERIIEVLLCGPYDPDYYSKCRGKWMYKRFKNFLKTPWTKINPRPHF
jgi:glycosyltransferase involved in cell wall biosynthesis